MKVSECMSSDVQLASPTESLQDAAFKMAQIDAGVLPVGENDRLVGIITDRDIAIRAVGAGRSPDAKIRDVMSAEVKYCYADDDVEDILDNMAQLQIRRMPVVDQHKRLVGIVSISDLAASGELTETAEALCDITRPSALHSQTLL